MNFGSVSKLDIVLNPNLDDMFVKLVRVIYDIKIPRGAGKRKLSYG